MPVFKNAIPLYLEVKEVHFEGVKKVGKFKYHGLSKSDINSFLCEFSDFYSMEYLDCKPSAALLKLQCFLAYHGLFTSKEGVFKHSEPIISGVFDSRSFQWFCFSSRKKLRPFAVLRKRCSATWGFELRDPKYR